ncbi:hypothetical protein A2763_00205 [Candidatus Kaiserbacteria bacterium RIFCSPHIGHO2_01_FULL_54_36]|uniref:Uncharacterized protein n=1 Tax=Candidatus Kaiserbacteria bacterium RIFCSPHIGHO2_01_FULL_54_36 TaxID=1798482 RepID=A0A1F6CPC1_9BACT|nr:MAG: hypothetical protein A2763_00205 [Candidatus Kaiserbacteria bacterium RIFCSPHIGHO2_01_FULL_54_36]OGG75212.1 MAG: hypothetical protein A3A41_03750 [Candidatus Kaiserbacteria bacterium RIFCSPLOWO2_01_FULL_54_22]
MNTSRISLATGGLMIACAIVIDSFQFLLDLIPFVGWALAWFVSIVAALVFGIWLSHHDVSMMHHKRALRFLGTMLGEFIPVVNAIPLWTGSITYTVIQEWRSPDEI